MNTVFRLSDARLRLYDLLSRFGRRPRAVARLSHRARALLGENASARFDEFSQYREGWDFGRGRPLAAGSVAALELFLDSYSSFPTRPSLFMTAEGNLELAWESHAGQHVEVEFWPDRFQYAIEADGAGQEGELELRRLPALLAHLDQEAALES